MAAAAPRLPRAAVAGGVAGAEARSSAAVSVQPQQGGLEEEGGDELVGLGRICALDDPEVCEDIDALLQEAEDW